MTNTAPTRHVDPYPGLKGTQRVTQTCGKCGGEGWLPTIVDGGTCWPCEGTGTVTVLVSSARATARRQAAAASARASQAQSIGERRDAAKAALVARILDFDTAHAGRLGVVAGYAASQAVIDYRDHGNLEQVVDDYDYATRRRFLPRIVGPNRYPGPCAVCRQRVPAGTGRRGETTSCWVIWCTAHVPAETRDR